MELKTKYDEKITVSQSNKFPKEFSICLTSYNKKGTLEGKIVYLTPEQLKDLIEALQGTNK